MRIVAVLRPLVVTVLVGVLLTGCSAPTVADSPPSTSVGSGATRAPSVRADRSLDRRLAELEQQYGARIGAAVLGIGEHGRYLHRGDERFAFASTDKAFIAAATLQNASSADLDAVVHYSRDDLLEYAPITARHVASGMTVRALIDAALRFSDNTAANLLVERLGGPGRVERYLRTLGDRTTSVDRLEPDLNSAVPGDRRDTTTPAAFARDLQQVLLRSALPSARRALLESEMRRSTTGDPYIRAGAPVSWSVADKTGSGSYGVRNDIAVVRPPHRAPIVIVLLTSRTTEDAASQDALIAEATRAIVDTIG